jgi:uncharacterized protein (DUF433 family)
VRNFTPKQLQEIYRLRKLGYTLKYLASVCKCSQQKISNVCYGHVPIKSKNTPSKQTLCIVNDLKNGMSIKKAMEKYGLSRSRISNIKNKWKIYGIKDTNYSRNASVFAQEFFIFGHTPKEIAEKYSLTPSHVCVILSKYTNIPTLCFSPTIFPSFSKQDKAILNLSRELPNKEVAKVFNCTSRRVTLLKVRERKFREKYQHYINLLNQTKEYLLEKGEIKEV